MTTMRWTGVLAIVLLAACAGSSSGGSDLSGWDPGVGPGLDNGGTDTPAQGPTVAVTLAGQPLGDAVTASIDAAGGTLASADGRLTVTVPANAVGDATTFSIQPVGTLVPGTIGIGYQLEPSGVTFAQPVTLTYAVPEAGVSRTGVEGLGVVLREDASGHWNWLADQVRDATGKTVSATTTHFCETSIIEGVQLRPWSQRSPWVRPSRWKSPTACRRKPPTGNWPGWSTTAMPAWPRWIPCATGR